MKETITVKNNMAEIAGVPVSELAEKCGTPLYIYDENALINRIEEFKEGFTSSTLQTKVIYASKAFSCLKMAELCKEYGLGMDVVSAGELYTAKKAGFDMKDIFFHGNNKSLLELEMAIEYGVGTIVVDNEMEALLLSELSKKSANKIQVLLRINPGIEAHTHKYIQTAFVDSKFGISILRKEEISEIVKIVEEAENLEFAGFHAHIGSQIFEEDAFMAEIETICEFVKEFEDEQGIPTKVLDFGGGFGVWYTNADHPIPIEEICKKIAEKAEEQKEKLNLPLVSICIEPGRSLVAEAGYQLYSIGFLKKTQNRSYIFIDGGMTDNIRPALYQADYEFDIATNMDAPKNQKVTIAGKCCESGDLLGENVMVQPYQKGDLLLVHSTGAYGYSMASNYNKLPFPGVVFVKDGKYSWAIKQQTLDELIEREVL